MICSSNVFFINNPVPEMCRFKKISFFAMVRWSAVQMYFSLTVRIRVRIRIRIRRKLFRFHNTDNIPVHTYIQYDQYGIQQIFSGPTCSSGVHLAAWPQQQCIVPSKRRKNRVLWRQQRWSFVWRSPMFGHQARDNELKTNRKKFFLIKELAISLVPYLDLQPLRW